MRKELSDALNNVFEAVWEEFERNGSEELLDSFETLNKYVAKQERENKRRRGIKTPLFDTGEEASDAEIQEREKSLNVLRRERFNEI